MLTYFERNLNRLLRDRMMLWTGLRRIGQSRGASLTRILQKSESKVVNGARGSVLIPRHSSTKAGSAGSGGAGDVEGSAGNGVVVETDGTVEFDPDSKGASFGVFSRSESDDIDMLVNNYTVPALAKALRDREGALQKASNLLNSGDLGELRQLLHPFSMESVRRRRRRSQYIDLESGFDRKSLVVLQRFLHRMPRQVFHAAEKRASVVIPLCNVNGEAHILFERRSVTMSHHKGEVCFPGGMVEEGVDATVIQTSLREMEEEIGLAAERTEVLGILRCKWSEVAGLTGVAVTPVIGYIGELNDLMLSPNPDEVDELFTVPISECLKGENWKRRHLSTPTFYGAKHTIWGLTGYLLERFIVDVVGKCSKEGSFAGQHKDMAEEVKDEDMTDMPTPIQPKI